MSYLKDSIAKSHALSDAPTLGNLHPDARAQAISRASREDEASARLHWLHSPASNNVNGYEWGIYRLKWQNGKPVEVCQTLADFSDLDEAMALEHTHAMNGSTPDSLPPLGRKVEPAPAPAPPAPPWKPMPRHDGYESDGKSVRRITPPP